jgi:predicted phosphodiesterase
MRLALLSDIHGNLGALRAVLHDIDRRGVDQIANLGDSLSGALLPRETADFLARQAWVQLAGNHERQLLEFDEVAGSDSDRYALARLDTSILTWLSKLPKTARVGDDVLLCHGTPGSDCTNFLETVEAEGIRLATSGEIQARLGPSTARLIACGHTHLPRAVRIPDGTLIVNPGSVGLPAFDVSRPHPHRVENGSPDARYAIVERCGDDWNVELRTVAYDHGSAASLAEAHGRPDWAYALRTGYAYSRQR